MARLARLSLPAQLHHVVQRGHNGQNICLRDADYRTLRTLLHASAQQFHVAVHAFLLLPTHFHVLLTPPSASALPAFMQAVGRRYVRYFNDSNARSGTLWDGRYRASVLQAQTYLLSAMAYLDQHPVRDGLVAAAADYPWSSHRHYIGQTTDKGLTPHALFWELGNTPFAREAAYARLVQTPVGAQLVQAIDDATWSGWALGSPQYLAALQKSTTRRLREAPPGRPRRPPSAPAPAPAPDPAS